MIVARGAEALEAGRLAAVDRGVFWVRNCVGARAVSAADRVEICARLGGGVDIWEIDGPATLSRKRDLLGFPVKRGGAVN